MATVEKTPTSSSDTLDLPLFRFGLKQLFALMAACSVLLMALIAAGGTTAMAMLIGVIVVVLHFFATTLGGRLRERADNENAFEAADHLPSDSIATAMERSQRLAAIKMRARSPWHDRGTTVLPWLRRMVICAFTVGGIIGASYLAYAIGYRTSPAGVIVGGLSVAVLSGWFAFLGGSFYGVFRHGFQEAVAEQQTDK